MGEIRFDSIQLSASATHRKGSSSMRAVDLIRRKRDGGTLAPAEIHELVRGIGNGQVPDYQWAALLMAIVWRGLDRAETAALTEAMMRSGVVVDLSDIPGPKVDKHSTGGVGDKTSLVLAPIAAACGVIVPMVSGRGLGHTGGTLDKLEAIPGFNVRLPLDRFKAVLRRCGMVLAGQTDEIAPADRTLYALRDATGTVESIPLITSSILSKKLAEGIEGLVLDVKTGDGAFLPRFEDARSLAQTLTEIGRDLGTQVVTLLTSMDQPLGNAVGNALEVSECLDCLRGSGPADLVALSVELAAEMLVLAGLASGLADARARALQTLADGSAMEKFRLVVEAQGGDVSVIDDPHRLPQAPFRSEVRARHAGYVTHLATREIGLVCMLLGAGRERVDSQIDHRVGIFLERKLGDTVSIGDPLATVHSARELSETGPLLHRLLSAFTIEPEPVPPPHLVLERLA
jgi:pyrimidine-nucleoside phosphorylase/thymidine phosphorylase